MYSTSSFFRRCGRAVLLISIFFLVLPFSLLAGGRGEQVPEGVVPIDYATFWVGTNPLALWNDELIDAFNTQYEGQFVLRVEEIPGDQQYADIMRANAAAGQLPDIITGNIALMSDLRDAGGLVELTQFIEADPEWAASFHPDAFDYYLDENGDMFALPYSGDNIGIYWNRAIFDEAGVDSFPETWDEFFAASEQIEAAGFIPFAMDNGWIRGLMLANAVGTQPGGAEWLSVRNYEMRWSGTEPAIAGAELLRDYVQRFGQPGNLSNVYADAATEFLQGNAAMIANGSWMINNLRGIGADAAEGLYDNMEYSNSPGDGIISIFGEAAFAVGATTDDTIEGAVAFLRLLTSEYQMQNQLELVNRGGTVPVEPRADQEVSRLLIDINRQAAEVTHSFPHLLHAFPTSMWNELNNQWPAYVNEEITTEEFFSLLDAAIDLAVE